MTVKRRRPEAARAEAAYRHAAGESHVHGPGPLHAASDAGPLDVAMRGPGDAAGLTPGPAPPPAREEMGTGGKARSAIPATPTPPMAEPEDLRGRIGQLEAELEGALRQAAENWDKFLRERAEMENYRKRIERTYVDLARSGRKELLRKLLAVLDNLERALVYEDAANLDVQGLLTGLRMTFDHFRDVLRQEGVKELKAVGEAFDPRYHEAVGTVPATEEHGEGSVAGEVQKGYLYDDELLRPARVTVASQTER